MRNRPLNKAVQSFKKAVSVEKWEGGRELDCTKLWNKLLVEKWKWQVWASLQETGQENDSLKCSLLKENTSVFVDKMQNAGREEGDK